MRFSGNQVVAYNLAAARQLRGWTQERAAKEIAPYLGERWSKATFSAAERSVAGSRIRQFSADEIEAFARAFQLPVAWFFLPPDDSSIDDFAARLAATFAPQASSLIVEEIDERSSVIDREAWRQYRSHVVATVRAYMERANRAADLTALPERLQIQASVAAELARLAELEDNPTTPDEEASR